VGVRHGERLPSSRPAATEPVPDHSSADGRDGHGAPQLVQSVPVSSKRGRRRADRHRRQRESVIPATRKPAIPACAKAELGAWRPSRRQSRHWSASRYSTACLHWNGALGWQPSRFLANRAEAERASQLAKQLGSVSAFCRVAHFR
jgi:hypothetical protein